MTSDNQPDRIERMITKRVRTSHRDNWKEDPSLLERQNKNAEEQAKKIHPQNNSSQL